MPSSTQTLLIGGGAAAIAAATVWRILARHVESSRLVKRLRTDPQAVERARGGNALVDLGLRRAAQPILRAMDTEPDARVRRSVSLAIARRQWEPSGPRRVARLRQWASDELNRQGQRTQEFGPAMTRLSDMGGPRLAAPNGNGTGDAQPDAAKPAPVAPPAPAPAPVAPAPAPAAAPAPPPATDPTPDRPGPAPITPGGSQQPGWWAAPRDPRSER